jgi:serine/threonine protein kinase/tetratricopeptide (TPR) repeat protein
METLSAAVTVCSVCGESLNAKGECLACLLRGGLNEPVEEAVSVDSLGFGDFEIARREDGSFWELGCGAMGVTYRATDKVLHRTVALKVIEVPGSAGDSRAVRERFLREARAAAALRHSNVAGVFQFGAPPDINRCFYAMELVEGETLDARVRREGPLPVELALEIAVQVTRALMAAATQGLIHRDVKPGNIMLKPGDAVTGALEVKVIDFGLAKAMVAEAADMDLTHGGFVGTPTFASPEQFRGEPVDARSDIYSLGVTLWYALTGRAPFSGRTIEELRDCQARAQLPVEQLVARKIPAPVIMLLRRALAVNPAERPASPRELLEALESCRRRFAHGVGVFYKLTALAGIVAIAAATLFMLRLNRQKLTSASASNIAPSAYPLTPLSEKSIAVLPFENLSANPENAYFTDGIQEEILMRLAKIADLKVVSRTSTVRYKSSPGNLREIATQLGVANVLEGSVQRTADRVHVNVQLIKSASDAHLWAEAYDRKLTDIFSVESEIAKTIAETLQAKLTGSEERAISAKPTADFEAHQLYLKGRYLWNRRTGDNLKKALAYFQQAAEKDPSYALAYAGMADSCVLIPIYAAGTPQDFLPRARAAAQKAAELDDTLAEAHTSLAYVFFYDFENAQSVKEFERAISLNPNYATAREWYGLGPLSAMGEFDRAIAEEKRALELDPVSPIINADLGTVYTLARRYDDAIAQLRDTVEMNPQFYGGHRCLGWALELKGATGEAIAEYHKAFELSDDPMMLAMLAHAEASIGKQNQAREILGQLTEEAKARYVPAYAFAVIYLALGEKDQALDWLGKAARDHDGFYINLIKVEPFLDPLRGDPRFNKLVSKILSGSLK